MPAPEAGGVPARGLAGDETAGLVSGDAGTGVEIAGDGDRDAPDPEAAMSIGIGSGGPTGGDEEEVRETGEDALPPHVLLC